jgi:hypothetical protein
MNGITVSQRFIAAAAMLGILVVGTLTGAEVDALAWVEAIGVIVATILAILNRPPGSVPGDIGALLRDARFQGAVVTILFIMGHDALGVEGLTEEAVAGIVSAVVVLLASLSKRAAGEAV